VLDACARHGVPLIEDAAEALGAGYDLHYPHVACRGRQVGTIGRIGCYSFNGNKIMTTGGGGMLATADADLARRLKHLSTQAKLPGAAFIHDAVGYNYRLTNLAAALGCAQLERLEAFIARKRAIADRYRAAAARLGLEWQPRLAGTLPTDWLASCLVGPRRDALMAALGAAGITARPLWYPVSAQAPYRGSRRWGGAVADRLAAEGLSLPCSVTLGEDQQERVIGALAKARG
jgi:dTDP-4-amino-4,6-dideoxygalactose transaminase